MPFVGAGFKKVEALVGPWLEDEIYHLPGQAGETSLAVGAKGVAIWRKATNQTTAVIDATGEVLTDYGNRGDGSMKRLSPKV